MGCLNEDTAAALLEGSLAAETATEARTHADSCLECQRFLAALARALSPLAATAPAEEPGGTGGGVPRGAELGRYLILDRLGSGGMGAVYAAFDSELDRKVAIKLLHPEAVTAGQRSRLLREARAAARLSHPNVVQVFDVGTAHGHDYIAMEQVQGPTLTRWLKVEARNWRDALDVFIQAGRGLAAAHAAGLVHRDFKPDNVLVGEDGRARVVDFGLARAFDDGPSDGGGRAPDLEHARLAAITETGALVGTPRYMAPEQFTGAEVTPASDQFSFCVALYEALYSAPPFPGASAAEIAERVIAGQVRAPGDTGVPAALRRAVLRGLAADPAARHRSMTALLASLEACRGRSRRRVVAATAALVAVGGAVAAAVAFASGAPDPTCRGAEAELAGLWDADVSARMHQAFLATGLPTAEEAARLTISGLDAYAGAWIAMHREACEATQVYRSQSEDLLDLRMACLSRKRRNLVALVELLSSPDRELASRGAEVAGALPPVDDCADVAALTTRIQPAGAAIRERVVALEAEISRLEALHAAGRYLEGAAEAAEIAERAEAVGHAPTHARFLLARARLQIDAGDLEAAESLLQQAIGAATEGRDDVSVARAAVDLLRLVGYADRKPAEARRLVALVEAAVARAGDDDLLRVELANAAGAVAFVEADFDEAEARFERAIELGSRSLGEDHPRVVPAMSNLSNVHLRRGDYTQARELLERVLAIQERVLGPGHPDLAATHNSLAAVAHKVGDDEAARVHIEAAIAIWGELGASHPDLAVALTNLGIIEGDRGNHAQAREALERAIEIRRASFGDEHPTLFPSYRHLGTQHLLLGELEEAERAYQKALRIAQQSLAPDHPKVSSMHSSLGVLYARQRRFEEAVAAHEAAIGLDTDRYGPDHPLLAYAIVELARTYVAMEDHTGAIATARRALELAEGAGPEEGFLQATVRFALAQALERRDPGEALRMGEQAQAAFETLGAQATHELQQAEQWLAALRERRPARKGAKE